MNDIRKLIESLERIDEGFFSELDLELKDLYSRNPEVTPVQVVGHLRKVMGAEAAKYMSDQFERGTFDSSSYMQEEAGDIEFLQYPEGYEPPPPPKKNILDKYDWTMYMDNEVLSMMDSFIHKMKSQNIWEKGLELAGGEEQLLRSIQYEAEDVVETYRGSGEGIGTSDINHFVRSIFADLGEPDVWGWDKKKEGVEEEGKLKSDEEMERDKTNRYAKYNTALRRREGLPKRKDVDEAEEALEEKIVKVPRGLRGSDVGNQLGLTSQDAEDFVNSLGPDDVVSTEVVDPETGEVLDWPDQGTRRERNMKQYKRDEKEQRARDEEEHEEGFDSPYLYAPGIDKDPERAFDGIHDLKYDREFTDFYHIVWRQIEDLVDEPEQYYEGDYDIGYEIPVAIKRKDGKKFNKQDRKNFDMINKLFRAATFNIGVQYVGSSDQGLVARFIPSFH